MVFKQSIVFLFLPFITFGQISFQSNFEEALKAAESENKLIFFDACASWSEHCDVLERFVFSDLEVANFFNKHFINLQLEMEQYPAIELAEKFEINAYPTLLFLDSSGQMVHRGCGSLDAQELLNLAKVALNKTYSLSAYEQKYLTKKTTKDELLTYIEMQQEACMDAEGFANQLLNSSQPKEIGDEINWALFNNYHWDIYSPYFKYLIENKTKLEDNVGKQVVERKLYNMFLSQYQKVYVAEDLHDFGMRSLLNAIEPLNFSGSDTLKTMMKFHYAEVSENWSEFGEYAIEWVGMSGLDDPESLNDIAWKIYLFIENKNQLEIAKGWMKVIVDGNPEPTYIDTFASLTYKLGDQKTAVELEKQALELAQNLYEDTSHYDHQLKKFQSQP